MSNIQIVTDSTCDLSPTLRGKFNIAVIPLNIVMDDKSYYDGEEITTEEITIEEEPIMETVIKVNGMMCVHCKARVEKVCKAVPGVLDAVVDLQAKNVTVTGDADIAAVKQSITDADYEVVE